MKITSRSFILILVLLIGGVIGVLFLNTRNVGDLFSRSVNSAADDSLTEGEDPKSIVESLDVLPAEPLPFNNEKLIEELQKELLEAQNDPDKAIELRRRIQLLTTQK